MMAALPGQLNLLTAEAVAAALVIDADGVVDQLASPCSGRFLRRRACRTRGPQPASLKVGFPSHPWRAPTPTGERYHDVLIDGTPATAGGAPLHSRRRRPPAPGQDRPASWVRPRRVRRNREEGRCRAKITACDLAPWLTRQ